MGDIKNSPYFMGAWGLCWYIKQIGFSSHPLPEISLSRQGNSVL